jgi:hypothetical protein
VEGKDSKVVKDKPFIQRVTVMKARNMYKGVVGEFIVFEYVL